MIRPRWKKAINDLIRFKFRSLLVIFAVVIGVWGLGSAVTAYSILQKDLRTNFLKTNPPGISIQTAEHIDTNLFDMIRTLPCISEAELRKKITGRIQIAENTWIPLILFVVNDFDDTRIATFTLEEGQYPGLNQILIERDGFTLLGNQTINDPVEILLPGESRRILTISGRAHDPGQAPSKMDHLIYGYISRDTYTTLTGTHLNNELLLITSGNRFDKSYIRETTEYLKTLLTNQGMHVKKVFIPEPGRHPHQWQLNSLLMLLASIGLLAFILSSVLVVNIVSFLLGKQIRQIGMMKAIGATRLQVMGLYYIFVFILGGIALFIAVPLSIYTGKGFAFITALQLNFNIYTTRIPLSVYAILVTVGLIFPLLAATIPIIKGTRVTIREALSDYGLTNNVKKTSGTSIIDELIFISPITKLSIKNTFRQKWRLLLTVGTLALGFALFLASINLRKSLENTLTISERSQYYDISYILNESYPVSILEQGLINIPGIEKTHYRRGGKALIRYTDNTLSNAYNFLACSITERILDYPILDGTWLQPGGNNEVVINNLLLTNEPHLSVGDTIDLSLNNRIIPFTIIGIAREFGQARFYISDETYTRLFPGDTMVNNVMVVANDSNDNVVMSIGRRIEQTFENAGISVYYGIRKREALQLIQDHLNILTFMVLFGSILALVVGGLGLISTMNITIMERIREIGVMKAIGSSTKTIRSMITLEGFIIGSISLIAGFTLSLPLSLMISNFLGMLIFEIKLDFMISSMGIVSSIILMIIFIKIATTFPGLSVSKLLVRDALAYE